MVFAIAALATGSLMAMDKVCLNGTWDFKLEADKSLEEVSMPGFTANDKMVVPGCWDAMSCYYGIRGTGCYRRTFELTTDIAGGFLCVDGSGLRSRYWIDGKEVGFSVKPWAKLDFEVGPMKAGRHEIVAAVDSIVDNVKVKLFYDWYDFYAFGGFYHGVWLETMTKPYELRKVAVRTRDYKTGLVELETRFAGEGAPADFTAAVAFDGKPAQDVAFKNFRATLNVPDFKLWSTKTPNLHVVDVNGVRARFGVRQVGTANGRITLNGKPVYLKGVNRHEAHISFGAATPDTLMYEDIQNLKSLGGNFIRGSHYQQTARFLDLCDELGVLVWEESLGWGNKKAQFTDEEFCRLQVEETRAMVRESINHPSIIISAFLNEPNSDQPACKKLVDQLIDTIRAEDTGHLVTFACNYTNKDICHEKTDIISYNVYPCWYSYKMQKGTNEEMHQNIAQCHKDTVKYFRDKFKDDRPFIVSEIGVKADYGVRDPRGKAQYTEDFQAEYEKAMLDEMFANKDIAGIAIWQFTDAKTYTRRTNGMIMRSYGINTGGLYDLYRRPKLVVEEIRKAYTEKKEED